MAQADPDRIRWERIQALLDALEEVPAGEHGDYLARVCPDPELRREVLAMWAAEAESAGFLDGVAERLGRAPEPTRVRDLSGRRVGAYRLVQPLGRGGMGVVYEAERADGAFEQRVALKLLNLALAGTEAHGRFLAERQILAGLKHPAISHIVDGGITEDGTPWFAMEHVEGEPIDAYCDRRRLGIRERLELFLQVCDAVEHAHRRLVVHRDLKPANVLVTEDDRPTRRVVHGSPTSPPEGGAASAPVTPQVKLLDFGIAKLLDVEEAARGASPTRTALRLMTPEYASPEQVRGEPVTTASDVYQLGLLLYELLAGHRPYILHHRRVGELERVICQQPPARLSSAIFHEETRKPLAGIARATAEDLCRTRRSSPARLRRRLRGDLENIVLKALSKEPERRYGSADRLAQDIRRHLDGLPVAARSSTWLYRGRKFLERHAIGATVATALLVLAASVAVLYTVAIQRERDRAQAEAAKAAQVSRFLTSILQGANPRKAKGRELTARELLDRGTAQADRDLAAQPAIQAEMLRILGNTYMELGLYDSAEHLLTRAFNLRRRRLGPRHPKVATALGDLGTLRFRQGEYKRARDRLEEAASILEGSEEDVSPDLAKVFRMLGPTYERLGNYEKGLSLLERSVTIQERISGENSEPVAATLHNMANLLVEMGALNRARTLHDRVLAICEQNLGKNHPLAGSALLGLARIRVTRGEFDGVEEMHQRALAILQNVYGPGHDRVGQVLNSLGDFLIKTERYEDAVVVLQRALKVYIAAVGQSHPDVAYPLTSLGDAHLAVGRLPAARDYYKRSVMIREQAFGLREEFDPVLAHTLVRLGGIEAELGDVNAARQTLNRAFTIWRQAPEVFDPQLLPALLDLDRWFLEQRQCADMTPLLRRVKKGYASRQGEASSELAELEDLLAACSESRITERVQ